MQVCSICKSEAQDEDLACPKCGADLREFSTSALTLKKLQENSRVSSIRIQVMDDACPACQKAFGTYQKDNVPHLPVEGCSHNNGCRCYYAPVLNEIYP